MRVRAVGELTFAILLCSSVGRWQGQGANALASDAESFLRAATLGRGAEQVQILSALPENFPREFAIPGTTVAAVGSTSSQTIVVSRLPAGAPLDYLQLTWKLDDAGWVDGSRLGFLQSGAGPAYCKLGTAAAIATRTLPNGDKLVRLSVGKDPMRPCTVMSNRPFPDAPIPLLELPDGVRMIPSGGGGSPDATNIGARLQTTMAVASLADHFNKQLIAAGWTLDGRADTSMRVSVSRLSAKARFGDPVSGILILSNIADDAIDATFRVFRNQTSGGRSIGPAGDPIASIRNSTDLAWLERVLTDDGVARALTEPRNYSTKAARTAAYARLGQIGTPESIATVERVEATFAKIPMLSRTVQTGVRFPHPAPHMSDLLLTSIAPFRVAGGRSYSLLELDMFGPRAPYLLIQKPGERDWSGPYLAGPSLPNDRRAGRQLAIGSASDTEIRPELRFQADAAQTPIPLEPILIADVLRDSDGDGWTDLEERALGTDERRRDTDGDGIPDGEDICPTYAPSAGETSEDDAQILRRAIFAVFGLSRSHFAILVDGTSQKLQLSGFAGPVVYDQKRPDNIGPGGTYVRWQLTSKSGDSARVYLYDWEGNLAASSNEATLRRVGDRWIVVSVQLIAIS